MKKKSAVESLRESIRILEIRQEEEGKALKEQFKITYESLKPVNLIKSSIADLANSSELKNNLFESLVSILTGYLSKKLVTSKNSNPFIKILGAVLQFGVTSLIARNAETIRIYLSDLLDKLFHPGDQEVPETES